MPPTPLSTLTFLDSWLNSERTLAGLSHLALIHSFNRFSLATPCSPGVTAVQGADPNSHSALSWWAHQPLKSMPGPAVLLTPPWRRMTARLRVRGAAGGAGSYNIR